LNLDGRKMPFSAAHKLVFVGVAFALGVGDVRNTHTDPALDSNLQPSG
jgi:hypothetical protein